MHELWVSVESVKGICTSAHPTRVGAGFLVRNDSVSFPNGGPICLFALQSTLPLLPAKARMVDDRPTKDRMAHTHHVQCPDPEGRTIWRIEQRPMGSTTLAAPAMPTPSSGDLRIVVERIENRCGEGMQIGHWALVRGSSLYLAQPFCLHALQATLPLLPAMSRPLQPDDWMATDNAVICPDPSGNVILRIEKI